MENEESGLLVLATTIGGAIIGAIGGALLMNIDVGKQLDSHLSNATRKAKAIMQNTNLKQLEEL